MLLRLKSLLKLKKKDLKQLIRDFKPIESDVNFCSLNSAG